jgi:hypothetical protein
VINTNTCVFASVNVGAVSAGHLTLAGHVIAFDPLHVTSIVNPYAKPAGALENVKVVAPVIVFVK